MNFSLIKKVVAGMMSAVILSTSLVVTISAAPSNILITPDTEIEKGYISTMGGAISTVEGKKIRYTDQTSYVVYKIPLNKSATKANLVIEVSQNYVISYSTDGTTWTVKQKAPGLANVEQCSNSNKTELVINCMPFIKAGKTNVYFKMEDQTKAQGWGGVLWKARLLYKDYTPKDTSPATKKQAYTFYPGHSYEKKFLYKDTGSQASGSDYMRFCDAASTVTYKIPYDSSKTAFINIVIAANYVVWLSIDDKTYQKVAAAPGGAKVEEMGQENRGMLTLPLSKYKGKKTDYIYLKIGDQTTAKGWGAAFWLVQLEYGVATYNPFDLTGVKKDDSSVTPVLPPVSSTASKPGTSSVDPGLVDPSSAEESSSDLTSSGLLVSDPLTSDDIYSSASSVPVSSDESDEGSSGLLWYILIGAFAVLALGGAVAQFIIMEKKRRS